MSYSSWTPNPERKKTQANAADQLECWRCLCWSAVFSREIWSSLFCCWRSRMWGVCINRHYFYAFRVRRASLFCLSLSFSLLLFALCSCPFFSNFNLSRSLQWEFSMRKVSKDVDLFHGLALNALDTFPRFRPEIDFVVVLCCYSPECVFLTLLSHAGMWRWRKGYDVEPLIFEIVVVDIVYYWMNVRANINGKSTSTSVKIRTGTEEREEKSE